MDDQSDSDAEISSILLRISISLFLLPPMLLLLASSETGSLQSDVLKALLAITLSIVLIYIVHIIFKQRCQLSSQQTNENQKAKTIFSVFSLTPTNNNETNNDGCPKDKQQNFRRKIDPKYFKPKFIMHELIAMWDTTYTVITWGSFHVIGGTLVATERLVRKIKTKCTREGQSRDIHNTSSGRADSFASCDFSDDSFQSEGSKTSFRRVRSWMKRSYSSAKKKFNTFVGTPGVPQLTALEETTQAE